MNYLPLSTQCWYCNSQVDYNPTIIASSHYFCQSCKVAYYFNESTFWALNILFEKNIIVEATFNENYNEGYNALYILNKTNHIRIDLPPFLVLSSTLPLLKEKINLYILLS